MVRGYGQERHPVLSVITHLRAWGQQATEALNAASHGDTDGAKRSRMNATRHLMAAHRINQAIGNTSDDNPSTTL